jgi:hypothetical protein
MPLRFLRLDIAPLLANPFLWHTSAARYESLKDENGRILC